MPRPRTITALACALLFNACHDLPDDVVAMPDSESDADTLNSEDSTSVDDIAVVPADVGTDAADATSTSSDSTISRDIDPPDDTAEPDVFIGVDVAFTDAPESDTAAPDVVSPPDIGEPTPDVGPADTTPDPVAPAVPAGLTLIDATTTSITVGWPAVANAARYAVRRSGSVIVNATGTWTTFDGLTPDTAYPIAVQACLANGPCSAFSNDVTFRTTAAAAPPNEPPVARGETWIGRQNTTLAIADVRTNDSDLDGDTLEVAIIEAPANGTLVGPTNGTFSYQPANGHIGPDRFVYRVTDGKGGEDTAEVRIHIANRTFHVDPAGDDAANGSTPATAWKTLAKVMSQHNANAFQPGDAILLKRGATFRESMNFNRSGTAARPIIIAAYGDGARPIISGARAVGGWTQHAGSIWRAPVAAGSTVRYLFVNGERQTLARFPNQGWLRTDSGSRTHLVDAALTAPAGSYNGARAIIHTVNWAFESAEIATHEAGGRLNYSNTMNYFTPPGDWGYFLENRLSLLDAPGEWYFDASAGQLYLWAPGGVNPSGLEVDIASVDRPFQLSGNYLVADGLAVRHANEGALFISYLNHHITVRDCEVSDSYFGIRAFADDVTVNECFVHDTFDSGLYVDGARNQIIRNHLEDISMIPGLGKTVWGYMGLSVKGADAVVRHNRVNRVGYIAMDVGGDRQIIEENHVTGGVSILNDGGGIAFDFLDGVIFRRNLVGDTIGMPETMSSTQTTDYRIAFSLYFGDKRIENTLLEDNVVWNGVTGIHVDHTTRTRGNIIRGNLTYDHTHGITFSDYSNYVQNETGNNCRQAYDDQLRDNTIFATDASQYGLHFLEVYCLDFVRWGTFSGNRYLNPFNDVLVYRFDFISPRNEWQPGRFAAKHEYFTLAQWQNEPVALDGDSTGFTLPWTPPTGGVEATRLITNPYRGMRRVGLDGTWMTLEGEMVSGTIELQPFTGMVLLRQ